MTIDFTSYEEGRKMCKEFADNISLSDEVRMMASLNYTLVSLSEELNNINKNLEKIANKDFIQIGDLSRTINNGEFYGPTKTGLNYGDIICKQNKDGDVDRNIILD